MKGREPRRDCEATMSIDIGYSSIEDCIVPPTLLVSELFTAAAAVLRFLSSAKDSLLCLRPKVAGFLTEAVAWEICDSTFYG